MDSAAHTPAPRMPSWRKRHPVLARAVLYGLGAAVGGLVLWLLAGRKAQDVEDRHQYLWRRLESLPIVVQADPDAPEALKVLDAEYADEGLPAPLRARAERLRGIIARNRKDAAGVNAAYDRALALDPAAEAATRIEWALCLTDLKDGLGATRQLLLAKPGSVTLRLWADLAGAQAQEAFERPPLGAGLGRVNLLRDVAAPLPAEEPVWLGLAEWTPAGAALEATRWKVHDLPPTAPQAREAWHRLWELAPTDFEGLLAVTEGLLAAEEAGAARKAWDQARAADPEAAAKALALRSALAPLRSR